MVCTKKERYALGKENLVCGNFADILEIIIDDLQEANTVIVPEVEAIVKSIEVFTKNEKVKKACDAVIKAIDIAQAITPDIITLLKDLKNLLVSEY